MVAAYTIVSLVLAAQSALAAVSNEDTPCSLACGRWSEVVKTCYGQFGESPHTKGVDYSNAFAACLCLGQNKDGEQYGNSTMKDVGTTCQSCSTTPNDIKNDLSVFLAVCQTQATNGTAENATWFAPIGYKTGEDADGGSVGGGGGAIDKQKAHHSGARIGSTAPAALSLGVGALFITALASAL